MYGPTLYDTYCNNSLLFSEGDTEEGSRLAAAVCSLLLYPPSENGKLLFISQQAASESLEIP